MKDELKEWLEAIWDKKSRPEKVSTGQIWTVFSQNSDETGRGSMILVLREDEERILVVPMHHEKQLRRGIDVILTQQQLNIEDFLVAMSDCATWVDGIAFKRARFIGIVTLEGLDLVLEGIANQHKIASNLSRVQYLEMVGENTQSASKKAFQSGVLSLAPLQGRYKEFDSIFNRLYQNLLIASVKPSELIKNTHQKSEPSEALDLTESINKIQQLNDWYKHLPINERSHNINIFKTKKIQLLVPVLFRISKTIIESAISTDEYKQAYDILHNIIQFDSENHELAQIYIQTALLGGGGNRLPIKDMIPSVKMLLDADKINQIVEPDLEPQNWNLAVLEKIMNRKSHDELR